MLQQQRPQQRSGGTAGLNDELSALNPQEYETVCRVANQILQKTSPDDMEKIKGNLQNMSPEQQIYLQKKGMDPITYFFRSQALNHMRRARRSRIEMARNGQNNGIDPSNPLLGDPMMNPQQRQAFQMVNMQQRSSPFSMGNQQTIDPSSFIGNVENIQGQQADGLRSQEAGQLVVPASSSQMNQPPFNAQPNMFPSGQQMGQGNQVNMNNTGISPQFLAQQHLPNGQPAPQDRSQQAPQFQSQPQAQTQAQRLQAAQKAQMAISQAGQANSHMQQSMSQSPAMPMLNRPMATPGQMSPAQAAAQAQPSARQPGMAQHPANAQSMGAQQRPQIPPNLPPHVQEQLAQMSNEQLATFFMNQRRMMANNPALARANAGQPSMGMQQNPSQPNLNQQMVNGQMANPQNMRASLNLQQQLAAMSGQQQPNQMMAGQQMTLQQRQHQQQQQQYRIQLLRQHAGPNMEMTADQIREMDRVPFPPAIFNNNPNAAASLPKNIRTWGQLKQLVATNQQMLSGMDLQKLMTLQKFHLAQIIKETSNRNLEQNGQANWMPTNLQGQSQPFINTQKFQPGQQQPQFAMPQIRQITPQELQVARQRLGAQVQNMTDEQLRDVLRQRQMHAAQTRAAQALANQQGQQSQAQPPPPPSVPPAAPQIKQEPQVPQQLPQQTPQATAAKPQAATPAKPTKGPVPKQTPPASKRKMQGDESAVVQTSPVQNSTQPAKPQPLPTTVPSRPTLPFSREQLAAMTPQQRAQVEAHLRRQQGQTRGTITRAAAEDAWNNMPEQMRELYNEVAKTQQSDQHFVITPEQKTTMNQQLRDCTDYLGRMDALVQFMAKIPGHEKNVRSLLQMRIQLMRQFKPGPDWTLNEQFSISPEYLTGATNYIKKLFHHMIARVNQQQNGQRPGAQGSNAQQVNQNIPPLNASNLQQLQQQEEALQRARRASSQTAASATSAMPPAPFGAPSPQGVPHAYGPGGIPPHELKLPPPKKRKQSHPNASSIPATSGAKAQMNKQAAIETKPIIGAFKCSVPDCQYHYQGFTSQNDLDKHVEENHKAEEPIEDALEYALQSFSTLIKNEDKADAQGLTKGLGLTIDVPSVGPTKPPTTDSPAKHDIKTEGATPMGRVASQLGVKPATPASSQQPTPVPLSTKAPGSSSLKGTLSRDGKADPRKPADQGSAATKDPWADSVISLESIRDAFMDLGDDGSLGFGSMDEFLNIDMFNCTQDTPDSVETGIATQTPQDGELLKTDDMGGKNASVSEDSWIPMDWYCVPSSFEDSLRLNEPLEDIDWEMVDFKGGAMGADDSAIAIVAM
ncbi:hypothetical protein BJY04DRAFT_192519 [Aspergillus karnatakaensis]|uniref:uncharacterized protein n=1 Tax=Aspergillus karnatakaensis TaxID=1810916 RepID=UPI003CCDFBA6